MIGDKLVITEYHREAAAEVLPLVLGRLREGEAPVSVSVAGESGCGKSEIAQCLMESLVAQEKRCLMIAQDDYFQLPPGTNHLQRVLDISRVGIGEVQLDLLESHVAALKAGLSEPLIKPLVVFDEDRIDTETLQPAPLDVIIVEGTYTTLLPSIDVHVFVDRNYHQTLKARLLRARDPHVEFLENVLEIEHREIRTHKDRAEVIIAPPPDER